MRIYVSSTSIDLRDYRTAAIAALRRAGHTPVCMEDYAAQDVLPVNKCLQDVAASELYIGILAWRYGFIPPGHECSIVELEYRKAVEVGIPTLIFLLDETVTWPSEYRDADAPGDRLQSLRHELALTKMVVFFTNPHHLSSEILAAVSAQAPHDQTPDALSVSLWNVPYEENAFFTGREGTLVRLRQQLCATGKAALCGLGGIGKTQTAIRYAYQYRDSYKVVFWTSADSEISLTAGFVEFAKLLDLPDAQESDQNKAANAALRWLESNSGWLLILDNADRPQIAKSFRPHNPNGHLLVTSRTQVLHALGIGTPLELEEMSGDEAVAFLCARADRDRDDPAELNAIADLAQELGHLPLALEQAGAYITANKSRFQDYLKGYRKRRLKVLPPPIAGEYPQSVATTWAINFTEVKQKPESADLLRLSAFLSPDNIPLELITKGSTKLGPVLSTALEQVAEDPLILDETLEPLTRYSLICRDIASQTYSIHRIMQAVLQDGMDTETQRFWDERAILALDSAFPVPAFSNWSACDRLLAHAQMGSELITKWNAETDEAGHLLANVGLYLRQRAKYIESEQFLKQALSIQEKILGADHTEVARTLFNLGVLHYYQKQYQEAEAVASQVLRIQGKDTESENVDLATTLNFLGVLYSDQKHYREAEPYFQRALDMWEKCLGSAHSNVAKALNNLAELQDAEGRHEEAEQLCRRSLAIREKALGLNHPDVARSLNNLAKICCSLHQFNEAERLHQRAIEIRGATLGAEHPDLAESLENYSILLQQLNREAEAEEMEERVKAIRSIHTIRKATSSK